MGALTRRSAVLALAVTFGVAAPIGAACGTPLTSSTFGSPDGGDDAQGTCNRLDPGAVAADGGGFCCPIVNSSCNGPPTGGWAKTALECCSHQGAFDQAFTQTTDSHGCPVLVDNPGYCCLCPWDAGTVDTFACHGDASACANGQCPTFWKAARQCGTWDPKATVSLFPYCKSRVVRVTLAGVTRYYVYSVFNPAYCAFTGTAAVGDGGVNDAGLPALECDGVDLTLEDSCVRSLLDPTQGYPCTNSANLVPYCEQAP